MEQQIINQEKLSNQNLNDESSALKPLTSSYSLLSLLQSIPKVQQEDLKLNMVQQIQTNIMKLNDDNNQLKITIKLCREFLIQIGDEKSNIQKALITLILLIAELGSNNVEYQHENKFFDIFISSRLMKKVDDIFIYQIKFEQKQKKLDEYSQFTIQLLQIIFFINKFKQINSISLKIYGNIINLQIKKLVEDAEQYNKQEKTNKKMKKQEMDQIETEIKEMIKILNGLRGLIENNSNLQCFVDIIKIHEIVSPLIHISCSPEIKCSQHFMFPDSPIKNVFLVVIYGLLSDISRFAVVCQYLQDNHQTYQHTIPLILNYSSLHQDLTKQTKQHKILSNSSQQQIQEQILSSQSIICEVIQLFYSLIYNRESLRINVLSNPNLVSQIIQLTTFERQSHFPKKNDIQQSKIRMNCQKCLYYLWRQGTEQAKKMMIDLFFVQTQIDGVGIGGGKEEQNNQVIRSILCNIKEIYQQLILFMEEPQQFPELLKGVFEQIEKEGGSEEIDSHLFHSQQLNNDGVYDNAKQAFRYMINSREDQSY